MRKLINENQGTLLRTFFRSGILCATAFGLRWSADQIAATQLVVEAGLAVLIKWDAKQP